jgi:flagellar biosynthesis chaperone FliJ
MKNSKKLETVNQKIAELENKKKSLENEMIDSVAKQIAALLIKKRALNMNIPALLKIIEKAIDQTNAD